ncbi:glutathione S-transferase family protein [Acaryochloris marina]|uniref:glutathione S-transferase family protein n=1 Tax=Acaryochloris marina TaxID=155978 RepID=UPI001BAF977D|nr:glutathione S-transferase family protein [Acaryochloris marina]QUY40817.1 glutathione S-transferase family protein [Acaryochloris marina S15]
MISFYYAKPSLFSRPVWITLIEKGLAFDPIVVNMGGDQFTPEFRALNPFCRIPVLVDNDLTVTESQAILDYLNLQYPQPKLLPESAQAVAKVRQVQMITTNELIPAIGECLMKKPDQQVYAKHRAMTALNIFEGLLEGPYFGGDHLSLADIVAGSLVPVVCDLGFSLDQLPRLQNWLKALMVRPAWQQTQLTAVEKDRFLRSIRALARLWQKRRRQRAEELLVPNKSTPPTIG